MDYIREYENIIPQELCKEIIDKYNCDADDVEDTIRKAVIHTIDALKLYIDDLTNDKLDRFELISGCIENSFTTKPFMHKMTSDKFCKWHHDSAIIKNSRFFTYIIYLNDIEDGMGGTTEFSCGKIISPKAGKILLFPSTWTYLNRCNKVEKGERYALRGFVMSEKT
jgi:hypothetical protein